MGHFMNNVYSLELMSCESGHNIGIAKNAKEDAELHVKFLEQAGAGLI